MLPCMTTLSGPCSRGLAVACDASLEKDSNSASLRINRDIVQQRLTYAKDTLRPIHQFPERSAGDVAVQHIPEMKHERNSDQVGQLKAAGGIVFAQRSHISARDPFAIVVSETLSKRGTQIAAAPRTDAELFKIRKGLGL